MIESTQNEASASKSPPRAMAEIGLAISKVITDRRFALSYVAGKCKTSMAEVRRWMAGATTPSKQEWDALCVLSKSFLDHARTWEAAAVEAMMLAQERPRDPAPATAEAASDYPGDWPISRVEPLPGLSTISTISTTGPAELAKIHVPTREAIDLAIRQGREDGRSPSGSPLIVPSAPIVEPAAPAEIGATDQISPTPDVVATSAPRATSDVASGASRRIMVPVDFVPYGCKISRGRFIQIPLPLDLTRSDVERIHAFLLTQVDDPEIG